MKLFGYEFTLSKASQEPSPIPILSGVVKGRENASMGQETPSDSPTHTKRETASSAMRVQGTGGGRVSLETEDTLGFGVWNNYQGAKAARLTGLAYKTDLADFENMPFDKLAPILADLSPEISKAAWDFVLMANSGYEVRALKPDTEEIDPAAQQVLDDILAKLAEYNGTLGVWFDRLFKTMFFRGSYLLELILAPNGRDFVNIATPDTRTLLYRRQLDPERGQYWDFGQRQLGKFVSLNIPTIRYIPVHPNPDSIEGTSLCGPAFFLAIFLMALLRDIKRVIQHQGYLRLDVTIDFNELANTMPLEAQNNPDKVVEWMNKIRQDVERAYSSLEPDDTYIHSNAITVNNPVGTVSASSLTSIEAIMKALERMSIRALKSMPILLGSTQNRTETQANREWEIYAKGIETVQHLLEEGAEYIFELALRAQGIQSRIELRFAQFRGAEALRDVQTDLIRAKVGRMLYDNGWMSQDESAQYGANLDHSDVPEPRAIAQNDVGGYGFGADKNADPGAARSILTDTERKAFQPLMDAFRAAPDDEAVQAAREFLHNNAPQFLNELYQGDADAE